MEEIVRQLSAIIERSDRGLLPLVLGAAGKFAESGSVFSEKYKNGLTSVDDARSLSSELLTYILFRGFGFDIEYEPVVEGKRPEFRLSFTSELSLAEVITPTYATEKCMVVNTPEGEKRLIETEGIENGFDKRDNAKRYFEYLKSINVDYQSFPPDVIRDLRLSAMGSVICDLPRLYSMIAEEARHIPTDYAGLKVLIIDCTWSEYDCIPKLLASFRTDGRPGLSEMRTGDPVISYWDYLVFICWERNGKEFSSTAIDTSLPNRVSINPETRRIISNAFNYQLRTLSIDEAFEFD